jgi:hypothetical protein
VLRRPRIGVTGGIVLATVLIVTLEIGLIGMSGSDVNPLHVARAQAAAANSPPDTTIDCDNDDDASGDIGEIAECLTAAGQQFVLDNSDLILYGALGLAIGVGVIVLAPGVPPLIFATAAVPELTVGILGLLGLDGATIGILIGEIQDPSLRARAAAQTGDIALPAPVAVTLPSDATVIRRCPRAKSPAMCRRIARAARAYLLSLARTSSVVSALGLTIRRLHGGGTDPGRQTGTAKVLELRLLDALTAQQAAARAFARVLRGAHVNVRLSAAKVRTALAALASLKNVPRPLVARLLRQLGISEPRLKALIRTTAARAGVAGHPFDLVKALERPLATGGLRASYNSLTVVELARIVAQLGYEKRIAQADTLELVNDALVAQRACSPLQRRGPMTKFLADVRAHVRGPYALFLRQAAAPLFGNHAYPGNKPPTAAFTPLQRTSGVSPGHPLHAIFRDISDDKADGGDVGCLQWDFGDPASGASNVSFVRNPTHDYAQPGTYTVTLTAIDDDGFASDVQTGTVTATP